MASHCKIEMINEDWMITNEKGLTWRTICFPLICQHLYSSFQPFYNHSQNSYSPAHESFANTLRFEHHKLKIKLKIP